MNEDQLQAQQNNDSRMCLGCVYRTPDCQTAGCTIPLEEENTTDTDRPHDVA